MIMIMKLMKRTREKSEYGNCIHQNCFKKEQTMTLKSEKKYICIRDGHPPILLVGEDTLIKSFNRNLRTDADHYYELGPEVKIKTTVEVVKTDPVYRSLKDSENLGVGDYRG